MSKHQIDPAELQVLIVDDMPANLKILRDTLEAEGYKVLPVPNGQKALQVAEKAVPDIVLLDIMMPGMDGYQVCQKLKSAPATAEIPVIFITAKDDRESLVKAFEAGGVDYINKPFEKTEVTLRVETHLIPVPDLKATNSFSRISDSGDLLRISSRLIQIWYENQSIDKNAFGQKQ